jgi:hypothetical protein
VNVGEFAKALGITDKLFIIAGLVSLPGLAATKNARTQTNSTLR